MRSVAHGIVLIQESTNKRPDWRQDINQVCVFAEFKNINFFLRVPAEFADPAVEHAYWLVRATRPQNTETGGDTTNNDQTGNSSTRARLLARMRG